MPDFFVALMSYGFAFLLGVLFVMWALVRWNDRCTTKLFPVTEEHRRQAATDYVGTQPSDN